jgi:hypothetical protein
MVNKLTIEEQWKHNPNKVYYVIQNPRVDKKAKKMVGLTIKHVEYTVKDWDNDEVRFEKVDITKNKRFPNIIVFDKRYPDAENEVYAERVSKAKKKPEIVDSYGIFGDSKLARYHKLVRLHRVAEQMVGIYKAMKGQQEKPEVKADDDKITKDAKKGVDASKVKFDLEEVKSYFEAIQDTNYFEELETIQAENPDLAVK